MKQKRRKNKSQEAQEINLESAPTTSKTRKSIPNLDPYAKRESENYENPIASREYLKQIIEESNKNSVTFKQFLKKLKIQSTEQKKALDNRLSAMVRDGQIILVAHNYQLVSEEDFIEGVVIGHPDGFGFLNCNNQKADYYLSNYEMRKVLPGDTVQALPHDFGYHKKTEARIIAVKEHKIKQLVGKIEERNSCFLLKPEDKNIKNRIEVVIDSKSEIFIKNNQMVLAEIISYPNKNDDTKVRVVEVIGDYFAPGVEIEAALRRFEIPHDWPEAVLSEVGGLTAEVAEVDKVGRLDLRNLPLVTIDGEDAKDFDDAVYCEEQENGLFRLIVAIADVSHYVKPDTALDTEAYLRGNSVYFPGRVIPMLPEVLSNGLCSLNPNVDRLCFVCESELDCDGQIVRYRFLPAVMRSQARLTYTKVANILINKDKELTKQYSNQLKNLQALYKLYKALVFQRNQRGAIDFDSTETMIEFDENQKISAIHPVVRNDAHKIIEECMLVANVSAAHFCSKYKIPILYRNHATPPIDKVEKLQEFLKPLGLGLKKIPPKPKDIAKLLERSHHRPDTHVLQMVVLRSLSQAMYQPDNEGHFGLAYEQYAHFTSPIRRYPDLLLHRHLHYHLATNKQWQKFAANSYKNLDHKSRQYFKNAKGNMIKMGEHCSHTERRADEATRDVTSWLKCEYMQDKVGMAYEGCISGVTSFGVFVELDEVYVEGLVHVTDLADDYYSFDERNHSLNGSRTGKKYRIGDAIKVRIAKVDLENRRIDFVLMDGRISNQQNNNRSDVTFRLKSKAKFKQKNKKQPKSKK